MVNGNCKPKSEGVVAKTEGTILNTLELEEGWYRFGTTSEDIYACPTLVNCKGGKINGSVAKSLCKEGAGV